ncbi:SDR family oxidoreductase [Bowmanella yangjiangensis]|uniref:SDR family oxidoreductase n=1 Tax=Bowmanella yangjiangensis TaxID=2811230 RepID=A0ABS3D1L1_9ALTE|nr:SDR family oxidoreductase [Bowmanella yangjiangensis]MBN7822475.1 SDR family oxidoreductase [Bowmanella yangjiangensis]
MSSQLPALRDKHIVILGGSSGIGLEVARQALTEGASVTIASSNPLRLESALARLGKGVCGHLLDLTDHQAIAAFFTEVGAIDHLVYSAGDRLLLSPLAELDSVNARHAFELRFWSALVAIRHAVRWIRPDGSIVLSGGIAGIRPSSGWSLAASVCGAIDSLVRALALELAPLRINAVAPGLVRTELWRDMGESERQALYQSVAARLPVGRIGEVEDVAAAYLFLMRSGFANGQSLVVDGGNVLV